MTISIESGFVVTACTGKWSGRYVIALVIGISGFCDLYAKYQSFMYINKHEVYILNNTNCGYSLHIRRVCLQPEVSSFCCIHF